MINQLKQVKIFANIVIIATIFVAFGAKVFIFDVKAKNNQIEKEKSQLLYHIRYMYKEKIKHIDRILNKKIKFFSKKIKTDLPNKNKEYMMIDKYHIMLEQVLPSLSYIAIYDEKLKPLYMSKNNNIANKKNRHMLNNVLNQENHSEVIRVLEKHNDNGEVILIYAKNIEQKGHAGIIEIAVNVDYLEKELKKSYFHTEQSTFGLSLWKNKIGYNDLLIEDTRIIDYKYSISFDYKILIVPIFIIFVFLLLLNILYAYLIKAFNEEEKKVKDILNSQSGLMVIFTKNEIISCNKAFLEALGFENEEELRLNHKKVSDFFIPQDEFEISTKKDIFWPDYIIEHKKDNFYDVFLKDRYGNKVDIFDISTNFYIKDGDYQYYIASFITSRIRYERKQAFNLEKKRNQTIMDNSNDGFIDWNAKTNKMYISKKLNEIIGYKPEEITNSIHSWLNLVHPNHKKHFLQNIEDCFHTKDNLSQSEILLKHKNGKWIWVFSRIKMFTGKDDTIKRFILFFTDINDKKRQEQIMKDEISKGIEEIKDQQQLLAHQSKLASMGEMIGSIAHQWRQPLNELGIKIQSLKFQYKKGLIDEAFISNFVAQNKATIMFMSNTIDDFRSFYKRGKTKNDFSILKSINFCLSIQSAELKNQNINIIIKGDDFTHNGFDSEFKQVILNLINNSKDAFKENNIENREINILIENKQILFTDNAGGISENIILRIFEPYFTTKKQGKGTGIGLYMSKSIVEHNLGLLYAKNTHDGVCFTVDFSEGIKTITS